MRQAFAGMLWSKQFYYYDVSRWLDGDPTQPAAARAAAERAQRPLAELQTPSTSCRCRTSGSTRGSRPGTWRFHCVALAHVDPAFAKYQLILLCREWFQHPNGALPAYEWDFGDVNPPVQAWAALEVFAHRRRPGHRLPQPDLRQAAGQLHLVGQQGRRRGQQPVRGRIPRPGQHRPDRPLAPAGRRRPRAVRRHRLDGLLRAVAWPPSRVILEPVRPAAGARTWCSSSSSTSRASPRRWRPRGCGTTPTGCSTTGCSLPAARSSRSRSGPWSA